MAQEIKLENGEVRRKVKWATRKRKGASRKWKTKWVIVRQAPAAK